MLEDRTIKKMLLHYNRFHFPEEINCIVSSFHMAYVVEDYSIDSYFGVRITKHTESIPKRTDFVLNSENRIADVAKIKAMRPRLPRYAIFPPKDRRKLPKEHDYRLFCLFRNKNTILSILSILLSGAELTGGNTQFRSFLNQQLPPISCILIPDKPKRTRPN